MEHALLEIKWLERPGDFWVVVVKVSILNDKDSACKTLDNDPASSKID